MDIRSGRMVQLRCARAGIIKRWKTPINWWNDPWNGHLQQKQAFGSQEQGSHVGGEGMVVHGYQETNQWIRLAENWTRGRRQADRDYHTITKLIVIIIIPMIHGKGTRHISVYFQNREKACYPIQIHSYTSVGMIPRFSKYKATISFPRRLHSSRLLTA